MSSGPLSQRIKTGRPRMAMTSLSARTRSSPVIDRSVRSSNDSRVCSSTTWCQVIAGSRLAPPLSFPELDLVMNVSSTSPILWRASNKIELFSKSIPNVRRPPRTPWRRCLCRPRAERRTFGAESIALLLDEIRGQPSDRMWESSKENVVETTRASAYYVWNSPISKIQHHRSPTRPRTGQ